MTEVVKRKRVKAAMKMLSVRMPEYVIKYFYDNYPNGSKEIRSLLEEYVKHKLGANHGTEKKETGCKS
jgi:hypothetical protein